MGIFTRILLGCALGTLFLTTQNIQAQTMDDALMMGKYKFCGGPGYMYSQWNNYWEGTLKRDNQNLGMVTNQQIMLMGNYGITNNLNVLLNIPYAFTKASGGTLHGMQGFQDLSMAVKWRPLKKVFGKNTISLLAVGSLSFPMSNYTADFMPMSIGMGSTNLAGRAIADYKFNHLFATASGMYIRRSNISISRNSYFTDRLYLTNQVAMPDVSVFNFRTGYRSNRFIAEALLNTYNTLGGTDIRRNDMPFPSNKMNVTTAGLGVKYWFKRLPALSVGAGGDYCLTGRNAGQSTSVNGSVLYIVDFANRKVTKTPTSN